MPQMRANTVIGIRWKVPAEDALKVAELNKKYCKGFWRIFKWVCDRRFFVALKTSWLFWILVMVFENKSRQANICIKFLSHHNTDIALASSPPLTTLWSVPTSTLVVSAFRHQDKCVYEIPSLKCCFLFFCEIKVKNMVFECALSVGDV